MTCRRVEKVRGEWGVYGLSCADGREWECDTWQEVVKLAKARKEHGIWCAMMETIRKVGSLSGKRRRRRR